MRVTTLIDEYERILPSVVAWIDDTLHKYQNRAVPVASLRLPRLGHVFPEDLLQRAKAVVVSGTVPLPPLSQMGLTALAEMEQQPIAGITYKDTFFVHFLCLTERLCFHELVHVVQWERLGVENFLRAYGAGLIQYHYRESPLEKQAYDLEVAFEQGTLPENIVERIRQDTDKIWRDVAPLFSGTGLGHGALGKAHGKRE